MNHRALDRSRRFEGPDKPSVFSVGKVVFVLLFRSLTAPNEAWAGQGYSEIGLTVMGPNRDPNAER